MKYIKTPRKDERINNGYNKLNTLKNIVNIIFKIKKFTHKN